MALTKPRCSGACYLRHRMRGVDPRKACRSGRVRQFLFAPRWIRGARCGAARLPRHQAALDRAEPAPVCCPRDRLAAPCVLAGESGERLAHLKASLPHDSGSEPTYEFDAQPLVASNGPDSHDHVTTPAWASIAAGQRPQGIRGVTLSGQRGLIRLG